MQYEFCTSSSLEVKSCKTKIMIFGCNKRKLFQEAFYLDTNQLEITPKYKYLSMVPIHMVALSHQVKGEELQV